MIKLRSSIVNFKSLRFISTSWSLRKDNDDKRSDAVNKLNSLLADLSEQTQKAKTRSKIELSKPKQLKKKQKDNKEKKEEVKNEDLAGKLEVAAKEVAESYGGDKQKTESELLNLLLAYQKDPSGQSESSSKPDLSDLLSGMKVERKQEAHRPGYGSGQLMEGRAREVQRALVGKRPLRQTLRTDEVPDKVDLWCEPSGLGIFDVSKEFNEGPRLKTWVKLHAKDLKLSITHPPSNIYEQMIQWTEQGKLWHFPIDNEQGLDEEKKVDFTEHVMLDQHLEPWCPKKGPIRNFMELVLVGLSKNPYYTVEEKVEHILWFRDYFAYKNSILKSLGLPEIPQVNTDFNIEVVNEFKKWGDEINRPRKY